VSCEGEGLSEGEGAEGRVGDTRVMRMRVGTCTGRGVHIPGQASTCVM
jgi:hypothetical protein